MQLKFFSLAIFSLTVIATTAQTDDQQIKDLIFKKDSLFWVAYNTCDIQSMKAAFTSDVEFYHDMGGLMKGRDSLMAVTKRNLCAGGGMRLRRAAVPGTVEVYPLKNSGKIYGAIISGEHVFYVIQPGKKEFPDGRANFSQVWILQDSVWQMSRVLSYNHHPAPQNSDLKAIHISSAVLKKLSGRYKSPHFTIDVSSENGHLKLVVDKKVFLPKAASDTLFFMTERDLQFVFEKKRLRVKEHGEVVEEAIRQ